jgi:hypothetical protein
MVVIRTTHIVYKLGIMLMKVSQFGISKSIPLKTYSYQLVEIKQQLYGKSQITLLLLTLSWEITL